MSRRSEPLPPDECAVCGAQIPPHARACPECGADERTGWRESSLYDGLDLPEEAWEDEERPTPPPRRGVAWYWVLTGCLVLLGLVLGVLGLR